MTAEKITKEKKKNNNNSYVIAASLVAIVFTFAIMTAASNMNATPAAGTKTITSNTTTSASGIELSAEPVYQEEQITISETPINQTHIQSNVSGNGTINLPNSTETINNINNGSYIISTKDGIIFGKEVWSTEDETENVTTTFYAIIRSDMQQQPETVHPVGIVIAVVQTNSTGKLAPLDGMILAGQVEVRPEESRLVTLWEWESGTPLPTGSTSAIEEPPQLNTTTADTTFTDTNPTTAAEEGQQQQRQTTTTIPARPLLE
jgi:guanyl-specific ribonuclease Sa